MEFRRASLVEMSLALRSGGLDPAANLAETLRLTEESDALVRALLPEAGRRERLAAKMQALLARFPDPASRPPLFGVPVGVKDLLRVDGLPTRAGSFLPPELFAGPEASIVTRLKALGALVLGKTETDEFAYSEPPVTGPRAQRPAARAAADPGLWPRCRAVGLGADGRAGLCRLTAVELSPTSAAIGGLTKRHQSVSYASSSALDCARHCGGHSWRANISAPTVFAASPMATS